MVLPKRLVDLDKLGFLFLHRSTFEQLVLAEGSYQAETRRHINRVKAYTPRGLRPAAEFDFRLQIFAACDKLVMICKLSG